MAQKRKSRFWTSVAKRLLQEGFITPDNKKDYIIRKIGIAFSQSASFQGRQSFEGPDGFTFEEVDAAYFTDSYVRTATDKKVNFMFKSGWELVGKNSDAVEYIRNRLKSAALATESPIDNFLTEIATSLIKYYNCFLVKARATTNYKYPPGIVAKPVFGKYPVAGYYILAAETITIARDSKGKILKYKQTVGREEVEFNPADIIHIYMNKPPGRPFGLPSLASAIDDVKMLRQAEELVSRYLYKNIFPLLTYKVGAADEPGGINDEELEQVRDHLKELPLDGGLVMPGRHSIESVKQEGLSADAYLKYFKTRVFTALEVSATIMGEVDCYDEHTQTLTNNGFKYFDEVTDDDLIATYNPETRYIEFHKTTDGIDAHVFEYDGPIYHIKNSHVDLKVTPEHTMLVKYESYEDKWQKVKIKDLHASGRKTFYLKDGTLGTQHYRCKDTITIPCEALGDIVEFDTMPFMKFLGYYVSKGRLKGAEQGFYPIYISEKPGYILDDILDTLEELGLSYKLTKRGDNITDVKMSSLPLWNYLHDNYGYNGPTKHISNDIMDLQPAARKVFLNTVMTGNCRRYRTTNEELADDIHRLALSLGYMSKKAVRYRGNNPYVQPYSAVHSVVVTKRKKDFRRCSIRNITTENYVGTVYCYNVPNHYFITRRNGLITIQGNTANRSTSDNQDQMFKDKIKAYQFTMADFINFFMIFELLLEGGYDPFTNPDDNVFFKFREVDTASLIAYQNHVTQLFMQNAITHAELRQEIGRDLVTDEERQELYFNMVQGAIDASEIQDKIDGADNRTANDVKQAVETTKRISVEESVIIDNSAKLTEVLNTQYQAIRNDLVSEISAGNKNTLELKAILNSSIAYMGRKASAVFQDVTILSGIEAQRQSGKPHTALRGYNIQNQSSQTFTKLTRKLFQEIEERLMHEELSAERVKAIFESYKNRLPAIIKSEVHRAYNYGFAAAARAIGYKTAIAHIETKNACAICQQYNNKEVDLYNETELPPFHTNCECTISLVKEGNN